MERIKNTIGNAGKALVVVPVTPGVTFDPAKTAALHAAEWDPVKMFPVLIDFIAGATVGTTGAIIVEGLLFLSVMFAIGARQNNAIVPIFMVMITYAFVDNRGYIPREVGWIINTILILVILGFAWMLWHKR